jgi:hypothetical protein
MSHNRNPTGNNQHGETGESSQAFSAQASGLRTVSAKLTDEVEEALREYHRERITSNSKIAGLMTARGFRMR